MSAEPVYAVIDRHREFSLRKLAGLRDRLEDLAPSNDCAVVAVGSLGRLEASDQSDIDYIVLCNDQVHDDLVKRVSFLTEDMGLKRPNPTGVFTSSAIVRNIQNRIGRTDDTYYSLSQRMLLLLESKYIYNETYARACREDICLSYLIRNSGETSYSFLLNDLLRYFRTICVNTASSLPFETEKWAVRSIKLSHSRLIMHCGLLFPIAWASQRCDGGSEWLIERLELTPLERIEDVYRCASDPGIGRVLELYEIFLSSISDCRVRTSLNSLPHKFRYSDDDFCRLKSNSELLKDELWRFLYQHRDMWGSRFMSKLIF